jgi:endonuclease G
LDEVKIDLLANALPALAPGDELVTHSVMALVYSETHEQAKWVAHVLVPDVMEGVVGRTNDFREDPKIKTGSAVEADYFLKSQGADGKWIYDGFGYDRGHLAPSADFRWSEKALSESYYYSNMSPQVADLNRGKWSDLENYMRSYIFRNPESKLYIVTGPVLKEDLPVIERGVNQISIPEQYFKVAFDPILQRGIAFIMPNIEPPYPVESYAVSINEVESLTGIDFFPGLDDQVENTVEYMKDVAPFIPEIVAGDVEPIYPPSLPPNTFNTVQAKIYMDSGESITVCGTVVSTKVTRNGHVFLNLDKQFPNHIFTVTIWKDDLSNFSYDPAAELMGKKVFVTGKVSDFSGIPSMNIQKDKAIKVE